MVVGTLLWAKVGTHPPWPATMSYDPITGDYRKVPPSTAQRAVPARFHVTFLGSEPTRSWLPETSLQRFQDDERVATLSKVALQKYTSPHEKTQKMKKSFLLAVEQAKRALQRLNQEPEAFNASPLKLPSKHDWTSRKGNADGDDDEGYRDEVCFLCEKKNPTVELPLIFPPIHSSDLCPLCSH